MTATENTNQTTGDLFGEVIYAYTRADALADGVLVDAGDLRREAGFVYPLALTHTVWNLAVRVPEDCDGFQDETGRLWDVLYMAHCAVAKQLRSDRARFTVSVVTGRDKRQDVELVIHCGPGDGGEPVLTIMLPTED